jgi:hypothetical protein
LGRRFVVQSGFIEAIGAVAAAGLATVSATQVVGLGEDDVGAFIVELAGLRDERFFAIIMRVGGRGHSLLSPMRGLAF